MSTLIEIKKALHPVDFDNIKFITTGISKLSDTQYDLEYIYATEKEVMSSNGYSAHVVKNIGLLKPGYYKILKNTKTIIQLVQVSGDKLSFPDINLLENSVSGEPMHTIELETPDEFPNLTISKNYTNIVTHLPPDISIDYTLYSPIASYVDQAMIHSENKPIVFKGQQDRTAYIMPFPMS